MVNIFIDYNKLQQYDIQHSKCNNASPFFMQHMSRPLLWIIMNIIMNN